MRRTRHFPDWLRHGLLTGFICLGSIAAGRASTAPRPATTPQQAAAVRALNAQANSLLAKHCLSCHNADVRQGGLDLSRRETALAGGNSGAAILPGSSAKSLIWMHVASGKMPPQDRPRLSAQEKQLLRKWIEAGAAWPGRAAGAPAAAAAPPQTVTWLQRLTIAEYVETIRRAVGVDVGSEARAMLPPDVRADGFSNTAYNLKADLGHVEAYARLAELVVARMNLLEFASKYAPTRDLSDANMRRLIAGMGGWVLRGPLHEQEIKAFLTVSQAETKSGGTFEDSVRGILEAMLQSPRFIYRMEAGSVSASGGQSISAHQLASRLSYILWGGPPDAELLRAAGSGELADRAKLAAQVRRMLQDGRAAVRSSSFISEWLNLDRLSNLRPDPKRFPDWSPRHRSEMRRETLAFFNEIAWKQNRPLTDLLNAPFTFATPLLAEHYGLQPSLPPPAKQGLEALYTFHEGSGNTIHDKSGAGEPLDLIIEDPAAVKWEKGRLTLRSGALIATRSSPRRLVDAVKKSSAFTIEAWISSGKTQQTGPARIVTLSSGPSRRNFTLGQDADRYDVRFRTSRTDANGQPGLASPTGTVESRLTHVVYVRDSSGKARLFVDGEEKAVAASAGDLSGWEDGFRLVLGNETTKDRAWEGSYYRVAIYSRAFTTEEARASGASLSRYDLSSVPGRGGLLTQGSMLTVGGDQASMVTRGLFILHDILASKVASAPPGVDTTPVPAKAGMSRRAIAEGRLANPACGGCHARFEPFAFGLERFDGVGGYNESDEHGNKLRTDGAILFPGSEREVRYATTSELMNALATSNQVRMNITRKATQFALGRPLVGSDDAALAKIDAAAGKGGFTYTALMTAIVMSDLVQPEKTERKL